jgi:hypothetical protein
VLDLESTRWAELKHAYGGASDIPRLLRQLESLPSANGEEEPWFTLWSSLAHQGDVYSASFAAVPHVVRVLEAAPDKADATYFQFPAWIEVCRKKNLIEVPGDLSEAYFDALKRLPILVAQAAVREWDAGFLQCALLAIAAAKGQPEVAEAALELSPDVASEFLVWFYER